MSCLLLLPPLVGFISRVVFPTTCNYCQNLFCFGYSTFVKQNLKQKQSNFETNTHFRELSFPEDQLLFPLLVERSIYFLELTEVTLHVSTHLHHICLSSLAFNQLINCCLFDVDNEGEVDQARWTLLRVRLPMRVLQEKNWGRIELDRTILSIWNKKIEEKI